MFVLLNPEFAEIVPDNQYNETYNETSVDFHYSSPSLPPDSCGSMLSRCRSQPLYMLQMSPRLYLITLRSILTWNILLRNLVN